MLLPSSQVSDPSTKPSLHTKNMNQLVIYNEITSKFPNHLWADICIRLSGSVKINPIGTIISTVIHTRVLPVEVQDLLILLE